MERGETEKKLENLKIEREELQSRISELEKESGVERELIKKFQIRKPGEQVLVVLEPKEENGNNGEKNKTGFFRNFWGSIKEFFK